MAKPTSSVIEYSNSPNDERSPNIVISCCLCCCESRVLNEISAITTRRELTGQRLRSILFIMQMLLLRWRRGGLEGGDGSRYYQRHRPSVRHSLSTDQILLKTWCVQNDVRGGGHNQMQTGTYETTREGTTAYCLCSY